jgi:membrane protease YdiL (CAAX protease family)
LPSENNRLQDVDAKPIPTDRILPSQRSALGKIFVGRDGIRAGWSLLIFIAMVAFIAFCTNRIGHKLHLPNATAPKPGSEISPLFGLLAEGIPFITILLVTWIMSKIEHRPSSVYGLGDNRGLPHFLAGLGWGIACLSVLIATLLKAGLLVIDSRVLFGSEILRYGVIWLVGFLLVGLLEEYLTRGYVQYTLARGLTGIYRWAFKTPQSATLGFWTAAAILSFLFGLGHSKNPGESPIGLLSAGLAGMVFCFSLWRTGSLWWAIGFHTSWDWGQSFLYGVPDSGLMVQHHLLATHPVGRAILSGGTTGPEGSIFIVAILALIILVILLTLRRRPRIEVTG